MTAEAWLLFVGLFLLFFIVGLVWFAVAHAKYGRDRFEE